MHVRFHHVVCVREFCEHNYYGEHACCEKDAKIHKNERKVQK